METSTIVTTIALINLAMIGGIPLFYMIAAGWSGINEKENGKK